VGEGGQLEESDVVSRELQLLKEKADDDAEQLDVCENRDIGIARAPLEEWSEVVVMDAQRKEGRRGRSCYYGQEECYICIRLSTIRHEVPLA
jgi:hypothetical protein